MTDKCPHCGRVHGPKTDDQKEAARLAKDLAAMLADCAKEACEAVQAVRPDFRFLPIIMMNVVNDGDMILATTCEFPAAADRRGVSQIMRIAADHVDKMPPRFAADDGGMADDPTKH